MGGSNKTTQKTKDNQTSNVATTQNQNTAYNGTTTNNPYGPSQGLLNSILGQAGNIQGPDLSGAASGIAGAIPGLLSGYNPATQQITDAATYAARNAASSNAAAAGRDLTSPGYASSVGMNVANTLAPYMYQNYQQGLSQIPGLTQTAAGLPYSGLFNKENLILPIAQAFGSQTSRGTSQTQGSGTVHGQQFGNSTTTTTLPQNPLQVGIGGALGILGLLSQGQSGGLGGALGSSLAGLL